jgi:hypothetical protein
MGIELGMRCWILFATALVRNGYAGKLSHYRRHC